jgi:DNA-binding transcriptional LysR family regulator
MSELGDVQRGTLHVHASQTIASYWLPRHLVTYRARYPLVEVQMAIGNTSDVVRATMAPPSSVSLKARPKIRQSLRIKSHVIS